MLDTLAEVLVNKNVINENTELEVSYLALGLDGRPVNKQVGFGHPQKMFMNSHGRYQFVVELKHNQRVVNVLASDILNIDGMDPARAAAVWNIAADGGKAKTKKKPGRKPKGYVDG
jgi:hypothetical protein